MSKTNSKLAGIIDLRKVDSKVLEAKLIPTPDTVNKQGHEAYLQDKWRKLLTMLNTLKLENQYYRTEVETLGELRQVIQECATEDPYLTCQCIVYSRCVGEGMRTISHAASVFIAPYISGQEFSKRFYSGWDKKNQKGGVIFRPDDMNEIIAGFVALNGKSTVITTTTNNGGITTSSSVTQTGTKLTNAMKKGFKAAIESYDSYQLLKYKSSVIDIINLVHPVVANSKAVVVVDDIRHKTISAIMKGMKISADTWEVNQGEAGQIVAKAVKEGKLSEVEAKEVLREAKADNWEELLGNNKLGILAAIRNLRNILLSRPNKTTLDLLNDLVSNPKAILEGKIFPYQLDIANEIVCSEFNNSEARNLSQYLAIGYANSVPNLKELLPGRNVIFLDMSGSMTTTIRMNNSSTRTSCASKASLIAATIALATNADIIVFGSSAKYVPYNPNQDVFTLANTLNSPNQGGTNLGKAWDCAATSGNKYDRVFILSDNECNQGSSYSAYMKYVKTIGSPYIYSVDLAGYGTDCVKGDNVRYYYGYGFSMFEDIAKSEFNPEYHIEKVKKIII
jgi:60 kDa SS-A/Ro ribonucleoprotein